MTDHVEPGATVITDAWQGYRGLDKLGYLHDRRSQRAARARGEDPGELLPAVHRVASLVKRWLLGTHQGSVEVAHLLSYLNEFVFRFNRRRRRSRGLVFYRVLELAVVHQPVRYQDLIASKRPRQCRPRRQTRGRPPSLERPPANRPWRAATCSYGCPTPVKWIPPSPLMPKAGLCRPCWQMPWPAGCWPVQGRHNPAGSGLEVFEECEQGVRRLVSAGAGAGLVNAGEGLFFDAHVGVKVDLSSFR